MTLLEQIDMTRLPQHVAVIMDGNGRWAKSRGFMRLVGHKNGVKTVKEILRTAGELGLKYLTVYAFSSENWNRPVDEVSGIMSLLSSAIDDEIDEMMSNGVKISVIGQIYRLPKGLREKVESVVEKTKNNTGINFVIAISYSGRWEIVEAAKQLAQQCLDGKLAVDDISEEMFPNYLATAGIPDPELIIRTSGETRISNFLLYELAYSELYFTDVLWPDFTREEFYKAILSYQGRERRFGKTSEQVKK
ncbi:MAG: isoprenyl transferase [Bacteroidales bacterium]|nr:isoprenyl transferase [Bacteroidales bacterium]